ncbi:fructose-1-phosphate kinase [Roseimicrobium gellanilyticum]|uniref:1-phosphofructokinase n=1 Tax=Roseimicrobium gellanilyticum TaxID=748857 RepID=A0A366HBZ8_9BACT|nr:1-phosphofructokinase [Roseimicrobium gellanilyticum]RBP39174.1 fructose-1-phosphate kinase [Roseimicrobium gellanilyticum]
MSGLEVVTLTLNPAVDCTVTIPGFAAGAVNRVRSMQHRAGGKGVNVALALAGMGHRVAVTGFLGEENRILFDQAFRESQVADYFVHLAGSTRVGIKIVDVEKNQTTDINFPGLMPPSNAMRLLRSGMEQLGASWFVLSGSLPEGMDVAIYQSLIRSLRQRGCKVALDTSGTPLRHALEAGPQIIKPNIEELSTLMGARLDTREQVATAARDILQQHGVELVVVSMGAEGALFVTANECLTAVPPTMEVRSTVGAGDAMVAGIISGALRGLSLADQARLATASSMRVLARNSNSAHTVPDLEPLMSKVMIT